MAKETDVDKDTVESFMLHPAWELLERWVSSQGDAERLMGLGSWEEYCRIRYEVQFARSFRDRIDEYLQNPEL